MIFAVKRAENKKMTSAQNNALSRLFATTIVLIDLLPSVFYLVLNLSGILLLEEGRTWFEGI